MTAPRSYGERTFRLVRDAAAGHGGRTVKSLGDGLMIVFASAIEAVAAAAAIQAEVATTLDDGPADGRVRVGLHVGEPIRDEGDYFGRPVVLARRLCDAAGPGQILASDLVRNLVKVAAARSSSARSAAAR